MDVYSHMVNAIQRRRMREENALVHYKLRILFGAEDTRNLRRNWANAQSTDIYWDEDWAEESLTNLERLETMINLPVIGVLFRSSMILFLLLRQAPRKFMAVVFLFFVLSYSICNRQSSTTGSEILGENSVNGETYTTQIDATSFSSQVLDISLNWIGGSADGICLESFPMNTEEFVEVPFFIEDVCESEEQNLCPCGSFPTGSVVFKCQAWSGSSDLNLLITENKFVTDIPAGVKGLTITLAAQGDLDLQLYEGFQDDLGSSLAGYGCQHGSQAPETFSHAGTSICFSGDAREAPVVETISVDAVLTPLSLWVKSYETTSGTVTYSWDSVEPCDFDNFGCRSCGGDHYVECVELSVAATAALACDEYETQICGRECDEFYNIHRTECTEYPTKSPPISTPTGTPSAAPTPAAPSTKPTQAPDTSSPTSYPSKSPTISAPSWSPVLYPCEKAEVLDIVISTCSDEETAGSASMNLQARLCDVDSNCNVVTLEPQPSLPGNEYRYRISDDEIYDQFSDLTISLDFLPDSEDGVCIELMTVGNNNTFVGPFFWTWEGSSDMALIIGTERWVTDIPMNVAALNITLISKADFDLQLHYGTKQDRDATTPCLVGYDCIQDTDCTKIWTEYDNMVLVFTGDDRSSPVTETILVVHTNVPLSLYVKSHGLMVMITDETV